MSNIATSDLRSRMPSGVPFSRASFQRTSHSVQATYPLATPSRSTHASRLMPAQQATPPQTSLPQAAGLYQAGPSLGATALLHTPPPPGSHKVCVVCVRPIEPSTQEKDTWKGYHQPLEMDITVDRLRPAEKYPSRKDSANVHTCCWEVAWNVLGCPPVKNPLLNDFTRHLILLSPFAQKTPFDCETNDVDHELWAETPSDARIEWGHEQETRGIISSMLQETLSWLDANPGRICIDDVQNVEKFLAFCLIKGIPYQLSKDKSTDVRPHLQRALQSFKSSCASRLPKTTNLWVAWNNAKSALNALQSSPLPQPLRLNPDLCGLTAVTKYCVPAERCRRLIFSFKSYPGVSSGSGPTLGLVSFAYDGKLVGSGLGGLTAVLRVQSLSGIHIVQARAGSITAVRVRDGQRWSAWCGAPESGTNDSEHEWDSPRKNLIFSYDTKLLQIIGVGVKSGV